MSGPPKPPQKPPPVPPPLNSLADLGRLLLLNTDSYKTSHWLQYPPGTTHVHSYVESRGGIHDRLLFFGLQAILKEYFLQPVQAAQVDYAAELCTAHGVPFNHAGWMHIVQAHGGRLPLRVQAVPEGSVVPVHQVLMTVENTDPECAWLTSYLETALLRVWYPTTVASNSWMSKQLLRQFLQETGTPEDLALKLHDFGARGVSSLESAVLGGMAHLVNFQGTDTLSAVLGARLYYHEPMAGYSIPAAEHSTVTAWGRESEAAAYRNMLAQYARPGAVLAVVSDSYDLDHAVRALWGAELRQHVIDSGALVVVRPDSGDPPAVVLRTVQQLEAAYGSTLNGKGYRVLNHVRVIQGDGVTLRSMRSILNGLKAHRYSADNVAFGQGGALLQVVNRDDQRFAMKASAVQIRGDDGQLRWRDVYKDPATDPAKKSRGGRLLLLRKGGEFRTLGVDDKRTAAKLAEGWQPLLRTVFEDGQLLVDEPLALIRQRAEEAAVGYRPGYFSAAP